MNKTKTIYFLSAVVLIIGCYALNLSYSMFVQTEEKEIVNANVLSLVYNLEQDTFNIPANEKQIITLKINNNGSSNIKYGVLLDSSNSDLINIKLVEISDNDITGILNTNSSKFIKLYVENNSTEIVTLKFKMEATYETLNFDTDKYTINSKIDSTNKYKLKLNDNILLDNRINKEKEENAPFDLYKSEDDYGESWYFKGKQDYNYVLFANQVWRIVRINGNNTTRLILNNVLEEKTKYNETSELGYEYKNSTIQNNINKFYETNIKDNYSNYLVDGIFCNNKFILNNDEYTISLKCSEETVEDYSNISYLIALLSSNELALSKDENNLTYLYDKDTFNELDGYWWTMSYNENNNLIVSNLSDNTIDNKIYNSDGYVRPVININENVLIQSGNGTIDMPYQLIIEKDTVNEQELDA